MEYLCKSQPTKADLNRLRQEGRELRKVVEDYIAGKTTKTEFLRAKRRINDLLVLANAAYKRSKKNSLTIIGE